jgi:hypothetical protein
MGLGWLVVGGMGYRKTQAARLLASFREAVYQALLANGAVGANVFPSFAPVGTQGAAITYQVLSISRPHGVKRPNQIASARVILAAISPDPDERTAKTNGLHLVFDNFRGFLAVPGAASVEVVETILVDERDDAFDSLEGSTLSFRTVVEYVFRFRE